MPTSQTNQYRVNLHILSPVHIGAGQELDPFSYVIRGQTLFLIDLITWMNQYPDKGTLNRMMDSDNYANIRSFIADQIDLNVAMLCAIPVDCPKLLKTYSAAIKERNPRNQVLISPTTRNEVTKCAYIPGSSIKGSIRTAIANRFVKDAGVTARDSRPPDDYNKKIFGGIKDDPMRNLKISDVSLGDSGTAIVEAEEYPLNPDKSLTPKGYVETTLSLCHTGQNYIYPLRLALSPFNLHGARVDPGFLLDALYRFYVSKYQDEYVKFYSKNRSRSIQQGLAPMSKAVSDLKTNETLIRLGHYSHVECVTLDDVRRPRTRKGRDGRPLPWGKTRTLANGIYPFGWAKLEFLDMESKERPEKAWPFNIELEGTDHVRFVPEVFSPDAKTDDSGPDEQTILTAEPEKPIKKRKPIISPVENLLHKLSLIKSSETGRISGEIINNMEAMLESEDEKIIIAKAIKEKVNPKVFKKMDKKKNGYLNRLLEKNKG